MVENVVPKGITVAEYLRENLKTLFSEVFIGKRLYLLEKDTSDCVFDPPFIFVIFHTHTYTVSNVNVCDDIFHNPILLSCLDRCIQDMEVDILNRRILGNSFSSVFECEGIEHSVRYIQEV